ncbi:MAG: ABC transporter substrate-binding protein [Candidatus Dormibacteraeota bacterium]|nr:ABC transporter substrate-binding protein [Candidatus Dormibacteraeota bacterium]
MAALGNQLNRRSFLSAAGRGAAGLAGAAALGDLVAACGGSTSSGGGIQPVKVQLLWIEDVEFAGNLATEKQGFGKAEGVKQSLIPGGPQTNAIQAVAGGSAPIGLVGGSDNISQARASGIPVKAFATTYQIGPSGLMSLAKNPIKTMHDAIGKKIGLQAGARPIWNEMLAVNNIPASKMTIVPVGFDPSVLVNGQVDGYWSYAFNQPLTLEQQGVKVHMMLAQDVGVPSYGDVIFTLDHVLQNQEDLLVKWLRATVKGWQYFLANPDAMVSYTVKRSPSLKLDPTQQKAQAQAQMHYLTSDLTKRKGLLWIDKQVFQKGIDVLMKTNQIHTAPKIDDVMTTSVLEKAYGGKTKL